jgi:hypothetical protein
VSCAPLPSERVRSSAQPGHPYPRASEDAAFPAAGHDISEKARGASIDWLGKRDSNHRWPSDVASRIYRWRAATADKGRYSRARFILPRACREAAIYWPGRLITSGWPKGWSAPRDDAIIDKENRICSRRCHQRRLSILAQHLAYLRSESGKAERPYDELNPRIKASVVDDRVPSVACRE